MSGRVLAGLRVSVVVPARNAGEDLAALLDALAQQTLRREEFEVVIGDDGSTDGSADKFSSDDGWVRVAPGPPTNSYAARNRAARAARAPVLAFCDSDCVPDPDWLERGLAALGGAEIVAGRIRFSVPRRRTVWTLLDMDSFKDHERQVDNGTAETANLFVPRELFERVVGFDDSLPEHGDFDFVARCLGTGARLAFAADAVVLHPTRNRGRPFLRAVWIYNRWYAARESRAGRRPEALKLRSLVPLVQTYRSRRRFGRSLGPDRRWLNSNGVAPRRAETLRALPIMYLLVPYLSAAAQLQGWMDGKRLR
jgi:glycosyltransferase involved in cell wall biosynthesis